MPWLSLKWLTQWIIAKLLFISSQFYILPSLAQEDLEGPISYAEYDAGNLEYGPGLDMDTIATYPFDKAQGNDEGLEEVPPLQAPESPTFPQKQHQNRTQYARPCVKKVDLYVLQPGRLNNSGLNNPLKGKLTNCHVTGCERPFSVQKIPHSNLILLVVDTLCPCGSKQLSITPQEIERDDGETHCNREPNYHRKRPSKCINYHPEEIEIKHCGGGSNLQCSFFLLLFSFLSLRYS